MGITKARASETITMTTVDSTIQNRRRYLDDEESDIAPKIQIERMCTINKKMEDTIAHLPTYQWLRYQTADGSCQPYQTRKLLTEP
jgi:hypothetical protein